MSTGTSQGKLKGRVAVITASTDGIGFAIAERFARDGAQVMISSRNPENVKRALNALKLYDVAGTTCHVGSTDDRKRLIKETIGKFGGIDILVLNAAVNPAFGDMLKTSEEAWDKTFDINVKSQFLFVKDIVPHMKKRGGGSIITINSVGAFHPLQLGVELTGTYCVSKTALLGFIKAFAPELASMNIRINGVASGLVRTKFGQKLWTHKEFVKLVMKTTPISRFADVDDIAGSAAFLVSDDAKYITGETIVVAGGVPSRL